MKIPWYEVIENVVIYVSGSVGICFLLLMIALCEGMCYIGSAVCLALFAISMYISQKTWQISEAHKNRRSTRRQIGGKK